MSLDARYASAISLLRGSDANFALCCASMAASSALAVAGIILMTDENVKRVLAVQSIAFLVAQGFTLTRVSKDWHTFGKTDNARPTLAYFAQVIAFFVAAFGLAIYSLVNSVAVVEWQGFYGIAVLWATVSTLCLSKAVRDRNDVHIWRNSPAELHEAQLPGILRACQGTLEYQICVWMSAVAAVGLMLGLMWTWGADVMAIERKGFISVCVLWCEGSFFHLAKLIRDRANVEKAKELRQQLPFQVLVIISSLGSFGTLIAGICMMPLAPPKRFYLVVGSGFMLSTAFFLAKNVRDRLELGQLLAAPELSEPSEAAPAATTESLELAP